MSRFEKYFWFSIVALLLAFIILNIFAFYHTNIENNSAKQSSILELLFTEVVQSDQLNKNLQNASNDIKQNLNNELGQLYKEIDKQLDPLFYFIINNNLENFLDFHYSVIGEYTELSAMATGKIAGTIEEKLLGSNFAEKISQSTEIIDALYNQKLQQHLAYIKQQAVQGIDIELNTIALSTLNKDINRNLKIQGGKMGAVLATAMAIKISQLIIAKISAKTLTNIAAKSAMKGTGKMAAASTAALAGGVCGGVGAIVCSPLFAVVTWFSVDAVFIAGDEYLNREEFKQEISALIDQQREQLKQDYKNHYTQSFTNISHTIEDQYKNTPLKERKKIKIIDLIF